MGQTAVKLIEAVADAEDVEPTNLEYSLQEYIPLEAVDQLATHEESSWTISFELPDYNVTVTSDENIFVDVNAVDKKDGCVQGSSPADEQNPA